jgi:hypothetical protein
MRRWPSSPAHRLRRPRVGGPEIGEATFDVVEMVQGIVECVFEEPADIAPLIADGQPSCPGERGRLVGLLCEAASASVDLAGYDAGVG